MFKSKSQREREKKELIINSVLFFRQYPDVFSEEILGIPLNDYQKRDLRAIFRCKNTVLDWSRGLGKSWLGALSTVIFALLYPNVRIGIIAPSFRQSKLIIEEKIKFDIVPRSKFLQTEGVKVIVTQAEGEVSFPNNSKIVAIPMGSDGGKIRGYRFHFIFADEFAQIPPRIFDKVVSPMLAVKANYEVGERRDEDEIGNRMLIASSAYFKHNHFYKFLTETWDLMKTDKKYYVSILDYQTGIDVGLFDEEHILREKKRLSETDFDMEYRGIFPNITDRSWIDIRDLEACSILQKIETKGNDKYRYIMAVDVARTEGNDNTCIGVLKFTPKAEEGMYYYDLVYMTTLNGETFSEQARKLREVLSKFPQVERIYMDIIGVGIGLKDEMGKSFYDHFTGEVLPPIVEYDNDEMIRDFPGCVPLIYPIRQNAEYNHNMGMAVKSATQNRDLRLYHQDALDNMPSAITTEEEMLVLEAEALRRELVNIEAKPQGLYLKFQTIRRGRKDRWSALGFLLYEGSKMVEEWNKPQFEFAGSVGVRNYG